MHLIQLASNESAVVTEGGEARLRIGATAAEGGAGAMVHVRAGDDSAGRGQRLKVGETLVVVFQQADGDAADEDDDDAVPFKPYADYKPPGADDDEDDEDDAELKNQVQVTLVHLYGDEAVLRFAVPDEWDVAVAIDPP